MLNGLKRKYWHANHVGREVEGHSFGRQQCVSRHRVEATFSVAQGTEAGEERDGGAGRGGCPLAGRRPRTPHPTTALLTVFSQPRRRLVGDVFLSRDDWIYHHQSDRLRATLGANRI